MIMIFQLSDWFPKPMIWAIIVKFDQIRKNFRGRYGQSTYILVSKHAQTCTYTQNVRKQNKIYVNLKNCTQILWNACKLKKFGLNFKDGEVTNLTKFTQS